MKRFYGISCLVASLVCLTWPALSQDGSASLFETSASLRSGRPQQLNSAIDYISTDELARTLYHTLFSTAGSEPSSPTEASRVAKACGFVLLTGLDTTLSPLSATLLSSFSTRLRSLLLSMETEVSPVVDEFQWRAVELMQYSTAYDYYRSVNGPDAAIEQRLTDFANSALARLDQPIVARNNHTLKLAAALGHTGLMLRDASDWSAAPAGRWLEFACGHIEETMWAYQSDSSGVYGYSEGPYYFRYAMMSLLPFFLTLDAETDGNGFSFGERHYGSPLRMQRWQRLFDWIAAIRMPDGTLPLFEDTYANTWFPELHILPGAAAGSAVAAWRDYDALGKPLSSAATSAELTRTFDFRPEYLLNISFAKTQVSSAIPSAIMPDAGYAAFRGGWDANDLYFGLIGKHGIARTHRSPMGSGHKHANEGAFILAAGGRQLAIEPGYHSSAARDSLVFARNHNVILVDGRGADSVSYGSFLFGADAFMTDTLSSTAGGMTSISTAYQDAAITRSAYVLDSRFIVLRDELSSPFSREFTHQIHGNGSLDAGTFSFDTQSRSARWTSGAMGLSARVEAVEAVPVPRRDTELHAPGYKTFARHDVLRSTVSGNSTVFHSILLPHPASEEARFSAISADRHASVLTAASGGWELLSVVASSAQMTRVVHPALGAVYGNGRAWQCILDPAGRPVLWMLDEGSVIERSSGRIMLSSPMPFSALLKSSEDRMDLALRSVAAREVRVRIPYIPRSVNSPAVYDWSVAGPLLRLFLNSPDADVAIEFTGTPTSVGGAGIAPTELHLDAPWPNPVYAGAAASVHVQCGVPAGSTARLVLHDRLGREIRTIVSHGTGLDTQTIRVDLAGLSAGMYFLRLEGGGGARQQRILIL